MRTPWGRDFDTSWWRFAATQARHWTRLGRRESMPVSDDTTPEGKQQLVAEAENWERLSSVVDRIMRLS